MVGQTDSVSLALTRFPFLYTHAVSFEDAVKEAVLCEPYFAASMSQVIPDLIRGLASINAVSRRKMAAFWPSNRKKGRVIPSFLYSKEEIALNMERALFRSLGPPPDSHAIVQSYNHELQHHYRRVSLEKEVLVNTGIHTPLRNKRTMTDLGTSVLHTAPGVNRRSLGRHHEGNSQLPDVFFVSDQRSTYNHK